MHERMTIFMIDKELVFDNHIFTVWSLCAYTFWFKLDSCLYYITVLTQYNFLYFCKFLSGWNVKLSLNVLLFARHSSSGED